MGPFESSHQHGPPLLGRVRGPTRSPTSSLVCRPPAPSLPSATAPVVPGRWPTLSLCDKEEEGPPRCLGRPLPACRRLRPRWVRVSACPSRRDRHRLQAAQCPGHPERALFRGCKPYGPLACVPTHRRLRYRGRRKARYRGGWVALHRTGFAPVGRRTKFHDVTASSLPFDQPCLVAPCNNAQKHPRELRPPSRSWSRPLGVGPSPGVRLSPVSRPSRIPLPLPVEHHQCLEFVASGPSGGTGEPPSLTSPADRSEATLR